MDPAQRKGARRRNDAVPDGQLALPLFEPLTHHGLQQIHVRPWVADQDKNPPRQTASAGSLGQLAIR